MKESSIVRVVVLICALLMRAEGGGVTVIAHGANTDVGPWIIPMAGEMAKLSEYGASETACYTLIVPNTSGPATAQWVGGVAPNLSQSGEIFIKLDWGAVAGAPIFGTPTTTTQNVAGIAVQALLDAELISADTGSRPLVELPIHLLGHSRGASVVSEMARILGAQGIWVDQVTTWDSVPVGNDNDVSNWTNVLFMDNYWQGFDIIGGGNQTGYFNRQLTSLGGGYSGGFTPNHSDVHLWYHGTVDLDPLSQTAQHDITPTMRESWYTTFEDSGRNAGYEYSRMGGGDRLSEDRPADSSKTPELPTRVSRASARRVETPAEAVTLIDPASD